VSVLTGGSGLGGIGVFTGPAKSKTQAVLLSGLSPLTQNLALKKLPL